MFPELLHYLFAGGGSQPSVHSFATSRVEQLDARFGQVTRRFFKAGAEQLRQRITRLVFERQLLLPPAEQLAAVFLDRLVGRFCLWIQAESLVGIRRFVLRPAVPLFRVVWQGDRKGYLAFHVHSTFSASNPFAAFSISCRPRPVLRSI